MYPQCIELFFNRTNIQFPLVHCLCSGCISGKTIPSQVYSGILIFTNTEVNSFEPISILLIDGALCYTVP